MDTRDEKAYEFHTLPRFMFTYGPDQVWMSYEQIVQEAKQVDDPDQLVEALNADAGVKLDLDFFDRSYPIIFGPAFTNLVQSIGGLNTLYLHQPLHYIRRLDDFLELAVTLLGNKEYQESFFAEQKSARLAFRSSWEQQQQNLAQVREYKPFVSSALTIVAKDTRVRIQFTKQLNLLDVFNFVQLSEPIYCVASKDWFKLLPSYAAPEEVPSFNTLFIWANDSLLNTLELTDTDEWIFTGQPDHILPHLPPTQSITVEQQLQTFDSNLSQKKGYQGADLQRAIFLDVCQQPIFKQAFVANEHRGLPRNSSLLSLFYIENGNRVKFSITHARVRMHATTTEIAERILYWAGLAFAFQYEKGPEIVEEYDKLADQFDIPISLVFTPLQERKKNIRFETSGKLPSNYTRICQHPPSIVDTLEEDPEALNLDGILYSCKDQERHTHVRRMTRYPDLPCCYIRDLKTQPAAIQEVGLKGEAKLPPTAARVFGPGAKRIGLQNGAIDVFSVLNAALGTSLSAFDLARNSYLCAQTLWDKTEQERQEWILGTKSPRPDWILQGLELLYNCRIVLFSIDRFVQPRYTNYYQRWQSTHPIVLLYLPRANRCERIEGCANPEQVYNMYLNSCIFYHSTRPYELSVPTDRFRTARSQAFDEGGRVYAIETATGALEMLEAPIPPIPGVAPAPEQVRKSSILSDYVQLISTIKNDTFPQQPLIPKKGVLFQTGQFSGWKASSILLDFDHVVRVGTQVYSRDSEPVKDENVNGKVLLPARREYCVLGDAESDLMYIWVQGSIYPLRLFDKIDA